MVNVAAGISLLKTTWPLKPQHTKWHHQNGYPPSTLTLPPPLECTLPEMAIATAGFSDITGAGQEEKGKGKGREREREERKGNG